MADNDRELPSLNLLSLDGGGITGLSSLLIIKEIMIRLRVKDQRDAIPKPCEYFDVMAGSGTGAISAIMLGRLRMSIDDAIASYLRLMRTVFSERKHTTKGDVGAFKSTVLERELKEIIRRAVGNENEKMMEEVRSDEVRCKVVVYAMSAYKLNSSLPVAFRSYISSATTITSCTIWEALRAATAHPRMFKSIEVDVEGTGHPKTIQAAIDHTGNSRAKGGAIMRMAQAAYEMAEGSERVAEEMARRFENVSRGYHRLNIQQGAQGVEPSEWERLDEIAAHTRGYLEQVEIGFNLDNLAESMTQKIAVLNTVQIDGRVIRESEPIRGIRNVLPSSIRFTGREQHTEKVRRYFKGSFHGRHIFVLYGLGGAGKTQIALKCAEELNERFTHVMFVDASSEGGITTSLATLALINNLGNTHEDTLKWISRHGRSCLLIFVNADDPLLELRAYLPQSGDYSVLITTRCPEYANLTRDSDAVCNVSGMEEVEAVELLLKTAKLRLDELGEADKTAVYELLKSFDYLALAVVQAGAYIWKMQLSVSQYWDKYATCQPKIPEGNTSLRLVDGYPRTVYTTWELSLDQLSPSAKELLFLISFLHRDAIVGDIFHRAARNMRGYESSSLISPENLAAEQRVRQFLDHFVDKEQGTDAFANYMGELLSFSLVTYNPPTQAYSIHPLVQDWAQLAAPRQAISRLHSSLLLALSVDWGRSRVDYAYKRQILPNVNLVVEKNHLFNPDITDRFAEVYCAMGQYQNEALLWEQAISIRERDLGKGHPRTLAAMSSLGMTYWEQRRLGDAKKILETTLSAQIRGMGRGHPGTLKTMHSLALTLDQLRHYSKAEGLMIQVVTAQRKKFGEDDTHTLDSVGDLASIYQNQGRLTDAEVLRKKVMETCKQKLGEDHCVTLRGVHNLAYTYQKQGRLGEAGSLYLDVIAAQKRVLGEDHPHTLISIHNLASTYQEMDQLTDAEALYATVVAAEKRLLGEDHPSTLISKANLAFTYYLQGRFMEAEGLFRVALPSFHRVLGSTHPGTIQVTRNLASTYSKLGKIVERDALSASIPLNASPSLHFC